MDRQYKTKAGLNKFRKHLRSTIKEEDIENMTNILDEELADSQNAMNQIANIFNSLNKFNNNDIAVYNLPHDAPSKFLEAEPLKLVTPDLVGVKFEGEVEEILATMKTYADNLKKNLPITEPQIELKTVSNCEPIDVSQYAQSLEQLSKRLAHIRQNLKQTESQKDLNMERKLEVLNQDIKLFREMTESTTLFSKCSVDSKSPQSDDSQDVATSTSQFEDIINKLLTGINDVTYLRQNKG